MSSWAIQSPSNVLVLKNSNPIRSCPEAALHPARYARLVVLSTPLRGLELVMKPKRDLPRWTVGSGAGADFVITDGTLHEAHLIIERAGEDWIVSCHKDCWGFFVNNEPVETAVVEHGDRLRVGRHELVFVGNDNTQDWIRKSEEHSGWMRWFHRSS